MKNLRYTNVEYVLVHGWFCRYLYLYDDIGYIKPITTHESEILDLLTSSLHNRIPVTLTDYKIWRDT
jgi:hypothetical protein